MWKSLHLWNKQEQTDKLQELFWVHFMTVGSHLYLPLYSKIMFYIIIFLNAMKNPLSTSKSPSIFYRLSSPGRRGSSPSIEILLCKSLYLLWGFTVDYKKQTFYVFTYKIISRNRHWFCYRKHIRDTGGFLRVQHWTEVKTDLHELCLMWI